MSNQSCSLVVGNREKFAFEGCLFAFDKFSADNTKKFRRCDWRHDGCKVRIHTDASTNQVC